MAMQRKFFMAEVEPLGDRQVKLILSTGVIDRGGEVLEQAGAELGEYRANPIWLWQHDPRTPVGNAEVEMVGGKLLATVTFAPEGISAEADKICGLVKTGVVRAASIGFDPLEMEPMDPKKPKGPQRYKRWTMLEGSFVSIPANPEATVVQRQQQDQQDHDQQPGTIDRAAARRVVKALVTRNGAVGMAKGLYDVADLAYMLLQLGWLQDSVEYEAAYEEDGSQVPAMLAAALQQLGRVLVTMTAEEVAELVGADGEDDAAGLPDDVATVVTAAATPAARKARAFVVGLTRAQSVAESRLAARLQDAAARWLAEAKGHAAPGTKAGRAISAANAELIKQAVDHHEKMGACLKSLMDQVGDDDADADADDGGATGTAAAPVPVTKSQRQRQADALALAAAE